MKIAVLRTDFAHHGKDAGYKQILKYIKPYIVFGLDESIKHNWIGRLYKKYLWLYEFKLWKYRNEIDVLFIMYGEEFYRFSWRFVQKAKIVVTFHVPPDLLLKEINKGNQRGRVGQLTHWLNRKRFSRIDAAIITNENQRDILSTVIPTEKIFLIPLGVHLAPINKKLEVFDGNRFKQIDAFSVITVGNWMRDWDFYFRVVRDMPEVTFHLVNRNMDSELLKEISTFHNLIYHNDIDDDALFELFLNVDLQFLPLKGMASSNALVQSIALGCPVLISDNDSTELDNGDFIKTFNFGDLVDCRRMLYMFFDLTAEEKNHLSKRSIHYAREFDWQKIAEKTLKLISETYVK